MKRSLISMAFAATLAACTQLPPLEHTITAEMEAAEYPALVPIAPLLAEVQATNTQPQQETAAIDARISALRARAARLRGSVLSGSEQQRLSNGLR